MGVCVWSSLFVLLLWMWMLLSVGNVRAAENICLLPGCKCTTKAAQWQILNCTLKKEQILDLTQHKIPLEVTEIFLENGEKITFEEKSLYEFKGLTLVDIRETKEIILKKRSFYNLTSPSLLIRIQGCHHVRISTGAFENTLALQIEIDTCKAVNVEKPFKTLSGASFTNIEELNIAEKGFELKDATIGPHGPVTRLVFDKVTLGTISTETFHSPVAEIIIRNSKINQIKMRAFSAAEIPSVLLENSIIKTIETDSFSSRTLILNLKINNCTVALIEPNAILAAINNLTVQHSTITEIQSGAINNTAAHIELIANHIFRFHSAGFTIQNWNTIRIERNKISFLDADFLVCPSHQTSVRVTFADNEVFNLQPRALSFIHSLSDDALTYKANLLNQTCHCMIDDSFREFTGGSNSSTGKVRTMIAHTFCMVSAFISQCFDLPVGAINTANFTELVCKSRQVIVCEPYNGEVKLVNDTSQVFPESRPRLAPNWISIIIAATALLLFLAIVSFVVILVRGSRWLKRKRCFREIHYQNQEASIDEENTIETVDANEKQDDLTLELLQNLSQRLEDPSTHQEASEMIEQLYQRYIRDSAAENNNQEVEEAHLYEELGNLQQNQQRKNEQEAEGGARSILRLMEEKFNTQFDDIDGDGEEAVVVEEVHVGEYSEPSDAAVHLYSELKAQTTSDSLKSKGSNMASRPLPEKPGTSRMQ